MSETLHPGTHPDPDSLSAFLEGALLEHERQECLAHFAQCDSCREIVFLAQEPAAAPAAPKPTPSWQRWWAPVAVLSGAAACAVVIVVSLSPRHTPSASTQAVVLSAPPPAASVQISAAQPPAALRSAEAKVKPPRRDSPIVASPSPASAAETTPPPMMARAIASSTAAAPAPAPPLAVGASNSSALPSASPLRLTIQHDSLSTDGLPAIDGSVTDPTGSGIPGATVTLAQLGGPPSENARTDASGKFAILAVAAGKYELRIAAPGFQATSGEIELQPKDRATVAPVLSVGSLAESVEVTASAGAMLQTAPATKGASGQMTILPKMNALEMNVIVAMPPGSHPLPSRLPVVTAAASGKLLLAADSAGALFYSSNAGKSWKAVKSIWGGKVVSLARTRDGFQFTTDTGSVWQSADALHWRQFP